MIPKSVSRLTDNFDTFAAWLGGSDRRWRGGLRGGEYQQYGGSGDQEVAGGSDPERRVDAEGNAGDDGNARGEDACGSVDAPEPRRGTGVDCGDQAHAGRKSKAHQEACRRQDENTEAGTNEEARSIEVGEERGQPERQRKQVGGARHAPDDEPAGAGELHALGCHAAETRPKDQAEQDDAEGIGGMTEEDAHPLQESDLDHHEADPDQAEIDGAAHGQLPAGFSDRRLQRNDDRGADEHDRYQDEHGEGQRRDQVARDHPRRERDARARPHRTA